MASTSARAWERNGAALAGRKALNHYPIVVTYFWLVQCTGSSTGRPPSIEVAERGALSGLLMSEEECGGGGLYNVHSGGAAARTQTL